MTLIVTYAEGFLGCFTVEPDGSLRQRALIDTGSEPHAPQQLAELGLILAEQWGWQLNGQQVTKPSKPIKKAAKAKAPPPAQPSKPPRAYTKPIESVADRKERICGYLADHPDSTLAEILAGLGESTTAELQGRWAQTMRDLMAAGRVTREKMPKGIGGRLLWTYHLLQG